MNINLCAADFHSEIRIAALQASVLFRDFGFVWGGEKTAHVPNIEEIEDHIEKQVGDVLCQLEEGKTDRGDTSSGRLTVVAQLDEENAEVYVAISFELEEGTRSL